LAKYPPKWKNRSRTPKIPPEKIEYKGQKLTYFKKKINKRTFRAKKQSGAMPQHKKKNFLDQKLRKLSIFKEKKDFFGQKNKLRFYTYPGR